MLLIEDAVEAMGATLHGKQSGSFGDYGAISYNGNIKWHYKLYREAEKKAPMSSLLLTIRILIFGAIKKARYVKG